jgi:hypothetical protein
MPIETAENVFTQDTLRKLHDFSRDGKQPSKTNFFNYKPGVVGMSNAIFGFDLDEDLKNEVFTELIVKGVLPSMPTVSQAYVHLFTRNSFIPWHDDAKYKYTATVYLNESWNVDLGGLFLYEDEGNLKCVMPKYNNALFFVPPIGHTTTITAINAPMRESLQIFVEEF